MIHDFILAAYVETYPRLATLARKTQAGDREAAISFARNACYLETPPAVSGRELQQLVEIVRMNKAP